MNVRSRHRSSKKVKYGARPYTRTTVSALSLRKFNTMELIPNSIPQDSVERSVFQTMTTDVDLESGVYILRKLDNGKVEFVNVSKIDRDVFSSKEVGRTIKAEKERLELFKRVGEEWSATGKMVDLAARGAQLRIFHFMDLPVEIRCLVYSYAIISAHGLRIKSVDAQGEAPSLALGLLRTTKAIRAEAMPYIWKNNFNFYVIEPYKRFPESYESLSMNVKELTYHFRGLVLDYDIFRRLADFPQLKILNIKLIKGRHRRAFSWYITPHEDPTISKFSDMNGFETLIAIRGLEKVNVENIKMDGVTAKEVEDFEIFLNKKLTQERGKWKRDPAQLRKIDRTTGN